MSDLPRGWEWARLEDLTAPEARAMTDGPFGSNLKSAHYAESGPRVIRLQNIGFGEFINEYAHVSEEHFHKLRAHEARAGDLVVASLGQDLPRACLVPVFVGPAIVKADCIRVRLHPDVDARYVNYALQRPGLRRTVAEQIHGVGRPRLGMTGIRQLAVPLPPRAEQERIVAAVEEHLSRATALSSSLRELGRRIVVFRESSIACAFDASWPRVALEDVLARFSDCPHRTPKYAKDGIYPALRPRDVVNGFLNLEDAARVDAKEYKLQTARDVPSEGDVVYSRELSYGWASVVPPGAGICLSQGMVLMKPADVRGEYLAAFLNSAEGRRHAHRAAAGSAHPHLNLRDIKQYPIPVVPHDAQAAVLDQIGAANHASNRLAAAVDRALTRLAALRRSVLAATFSGHLVSQDPGDEPASVLLDRIRAERASARPPKRTRKVKTS